MVTFAVKVSRRFRVSPEKVFQAFTDPQQFAHWLGANKLLLNVQDGLYFWEATYQDRTWAHYGRFLRLEPGRLIEFTWMSEATQGLESRVTIDLVPIEGGTELTLVHAGLPDDDLGRGHEAGWNAIISAMAEGLA